jgi:hypothetical protein
MWTIHTTFSLNVSTHLPESCTCLLDALPWDMETGIFRRSSTGALQSFAILLGHSLRADEISCKCDQRFKSGWSSRDNPGSPDELPGRIRERELLSSNSCTDTLIYACSYSAQTKNIRGGGATPVEQHEDRAGRSNRHSFGDSRLVLVRIIRLYRSAS